MPAARPLPAPPMPDLPCAAPANTPGDGWDAAALQAELHALGASLLPGWTAEVLEEVGSTNQHLVQALHAQARTPQAAAPAPRLLVARRQTAGRGRLGRSWTAEPGASLTCSLQLPLARADWSGLSLAVGLALAQALDPQAGRIGLKWPNDLWLMDGPAQGRKLGGILIEGLGAGPRRVAVIGIGLNLHAQPAQALAVPAAALAELPGAPVQVPEALRCLLPPLLRTLLAFERGGFAPMAPDYARYDLLRGQPVTTNSPTCPGGTGAGVAEDGALRLRLADGRLEQIVSGEVSVRPGTQPPPHGSPGDAPAPSLPERPPAAP